MENAVYEAHKPARERDKDNEYSLKAGYYFFFLFDRRMLLRTAGSNRWQVCRMRTRASGFGSSGALTICETIEAMEI